MNTYKKILIPAGLLLVLLVAFFLAGKYFLGRISGLNSQITAAKTEQIALQAKLAILEENQTSVDSFKEKVVLALPSENPVLAGVSQIRSAASAGGVIINNLSGGQITKKDDVNQIAISFDLETDIATAFAVVKAISNSAPVSTISKFSIVSSSENPRISVVINYHWSALPKQLPDITDSSKQLTDEEQKVLAIISNMNFVNFDQDIHPVVRGDSPDRVNPFVQ
ncbi:MAG: hypothetical protein AAB546_01580 [Patescibacteria group bacterium]